jgi:hypothetical protein
MQQPDFFLSHLPFWVVNYGLALLAWTCIGRFMLSAFVAEESRNYIWRSFVAITWLPMRLLRPIVPLQIGPRLLPLAVAFWLFMLRIVAFLAMFHAGLAPRVSGGG